jgi:hypothetical protein
VVVLCGYWNVWIDRLCYMGLGGIVWLLECVELIDCLILGSAGIVWLLECVNWYTLFYGKCCYCVSVRMLWIEGVPYMGSAGIVWLSECVELIKFLLNSRANFIYVPINYNYVVSPPHRYSNYTYSLNHSLLSAPHHLAALFTVQNCSTLLCCYYW